MMGLFVSGLTAWATWEILKAILPIVAAALGQQDLLLP